jgi:hypothetical protein
VEQAPLASLSPTAREHDLTIALAALNYVKRLPCAVKNVFPEPCRRAPYIPPPVNNPSERINQLNQSFPLNGGLGNNPTNRDAYIRHNLNR